MNKIIEKIYRMHNIYASLFMIELFLSCLHVRI